MAYFDQRNGGGGGGGPFGGRPSYLHQLWQKSVAIDPPAGSLAPAGTQPQHYGEQVMIPKAVYPLFMKTMQEHLENLEENKAAQHMELARRNANDPNKYEHHFIAALRYKQVANSKDINDMIRNKLTDSGLNNVDKQIASLRQGNQLKTQEGMQKYKQLQMERNRRKDVLMEAETKAYNKYLTNPFTSMNERPKTLPENYAQKELSGFLRKHRGVIEPNEKGHLIIDGKTISTDPHDASKLVHYLTKDISGKPPKGVKELLQAMSKRGFDYKNNLGNAHLKKMLDENKKNMSSVGATSAIKRSTSPKTSSARKVEILNKRYLEKKKAIRQRRAMKNDVDKSNDVKERSRIVEKKAKNKEDKEEREGEASKKKSKKKKVITSPTRKTPVQTRSLTKKKNV